MANEFKIKKGLIINGSGSTGDETVLDIQGTQGQLFSVTDSLSGSLFAVSDISGIPILEVFSDDTVKLGTFGSEAVNVVGSELKLPSVVNAGVDTDKFLVLDSSNNVDFRTGAEVLSDIGGGGGGSSPWVADTNGITYTAGNVGIGGASVNNTELKITGNGWFTTGIRIDSDLRTTGTITLSNGVGTSGQVLASTVTGTEWITPSGGGGGGAPVLLTVSILNGVAVTNNQTMTAVNCIGAQDLTSGPAWTSSSSAITIPETGYYEISFAITTTSTGARATDIFGLTVNGTVQDEESNSAYIRNTSGINEGACILTVTKYLIEDDTLGVASRREGTVTTSGSTVSSKSGLSIRRLGEPSTTTGVVSSAESSEATRNIIIGTSATPPTVSTVAINTIYFQREA
jgi:hypothetical protein